MEIVYAKSIEEFALLADRWAARQIPRYQAKTMLLPSGGTPKSLYKMWERTKPQFLENLQFTQLDEVITGDKAGCFQEFFRAHLPTYWPQFVTLENQNSAPDLVVLGIGPNGHVAFHEPHVPVDFFKGLVVLEDETCARLGTEPGTSGLTFGVGCFRQAKAILMLIQGADKRLIAQKFLHDHTPQFPAAYLRAHLDIEVIIAPDAL